MHKNEPSSHSHTHKPARKHAEASITQSTPHPSAISPPRPARPAQHSPHCTLSRAKVVTNSLLPPPHRLPESHEMQKGRAAGGPPPSPGRAHRPLGQSCEQPRRCQPAHSGSRARRGERTIVAAAALGGGAAAEAARRVPGPCPQLPAAAAAEIWLSYYSPPFTGCECVCARL